MKIADFLKPTVGKIVIAIILFLFLPVLAFHEQCLCDSKPGQIGRCGCPETSFISPAAAALTGFANLTFSVISVFAVLGVLVLAWAIHLGVHSLPTHLKTSVAHGLHVTGGRIILTIIGWVSMSTIVMGFFVGQYGGTQMLPPLLDSLYTLNGVLEIALLPFTAISYALYFISVIMLIIVGLISRMPISPVTSGPLLPYALTPVGVVAVIAMMAVGWYLASCALVSLFIRVKGMIWKHQDTVGHVN